MDLKPQWKFMLAFCSVKVGSGPIWKPMMLEISVQCRSRKPGLHSAWSKGTFSWKWLQADSDPNRAGFWELGPCDFLMPPTSPWKMTQILSGWNIAWQRRSPPESNVVQLQYSGAPGSDSLNKLFTPWRHLNRSWLSRPPRQPKLRKIDQQSWAVKKNSDGQMKIVQVFGPWLALQCLLVQSRPSIWRTSSDHGHQLTENIMKFLVFVGKCTDSTNDFIVSSKKTCLRIMNLLQRRLAHGKKIAEHESHLWLSGQSKPTIFVCHHQHCLCSTAGFGSPDHVISPLTNLWWTNLHLKTWD